MSSTEQMLSIGSILLLTILILNFYRANINQQSVSLNNEAVVIATDMAQAMIEEIQTKAFDQKTVLNSVPNKDSLTAVANLGTDSGESTYTQFNDIDDYKNFTRTESLPKLGNFNIRVNVFYVNNMTPQTISSSKTFSKRIDISVFNYYLPDTLRFNYVVSY